MSAGAISLANSNNLSVKVEALQAKYTKEKKKDFNYFKIFSHFIQSAEGTYQLFKSLANSCKLPIHYASYLKLSPEILKQISKLKGNFNFINKNMILTKIPKNIDNLKNSYSSLNIQDARNRDVFVKNVVENVADFGFLVQLGSILSLYNLGSLSTTINLIAHSFLNMAYCLRLKMTAEDYVDRREIVNHLKLENKKITRLETLFSELKNLSLIRVIKSIISIALSTFLIYEIIFKKALIQASIIILLSTLTSVLSIWAHFYQKTLSYPAVG